MALNERKIAFIGAGHITNIILDNLTKTEIIPTDFLIVSAPNKGKLQQLYEKYDITITQDNVEAVNKADFIFINVPPQVVGNVISELLISLVWVTLLHLLFVTINHN